jgi:hypothetical protein
MASSEAERYEKRIYEKHYFNPRDPGSFASPGKFRLGLKKLGYYGREDRIKKWLSGEDSYSLHKDARVPKSRLRPVLSFYPTNLVEADLMDVQNLAVDNDGIRYILVVIDVMSKFAWVRPLKDKKMTMVAAAYENILLENPKLAPTNLRTDMGGEFRGNAFQRLCEKYGINYFTSNNHTKSCLVERLIRTLRMRLGKMLTHLNARRYIDHLDAIVASYNDTHHSSIKTTPREAISKADSKILFKNQYGVNSAAINVKRLLQKVKFKKGDHVRISLGKRRFAKVSDFNFSEEIFKVREVAPRYNSIVYYLEDWNGEPITGSFQDFELQLVTALEDKYFKIETVLGKKRVGGKTWLKIKYRGYPSKFAEWVAETDVKRLR